MIHKQLKIFNESYQVEVIPKRVYWKLQAVYDNHEPYMLDDGDMEHISSQITCGVFTGVFEESPEYESQSWTEYEEHNEL